MGRTGLLLFTLFTAAAACVAQPTTTAPAAAAPGGDVEMLPLAVPVAHPTTRAHGYQGLWWGNRAPAPLMAQQLAGGLAFEPAEQMPVAQYAPAPDKTFFTFAGSAGEPLDADGRQPLRIMVGSFDHKTRTLPRPIIFVNDLPPGAHGCPAITLDGEGRLWVFVSVRGGAYPSAVFRSVRPHEIDAWEKVCEMEFEQPQAWFVPGQGFILVHVRSLKGKPRLHYSTSADGLTWSKPLLIAGFGDGQSCVSGRHKNKIGIAFNWTDSAEPGDNRTDLYYIETPDFGRTWQVYPRAGVRLPLTESTTPAFVYDHKNWKTVLRDLNFDAMGNPVVFYITRHTRKPLPAPESRIWTTSRWTGREWETTGAMFSDSDHDAGCLEVDKLVWYATVPSRPGPQPLSSGGEVLRWRSEDQGRSWYRWPLTPGITVNHNWVRRVMDGKLEMSTMWADGNSRQFSESRLYFADRPGNVYVLPTIMAQDTASPELVFKAPEPQTQPAAAATQTATAP